MEFRIQKAVPEQYEHVIRMIQNTKQTIKQQEWFAVDSADYMLTALTENKGIAYFAISQKTNEIAGVFMYVVPGNQPENLGLDIDLPPKELPYVVNMDTVSVLPSYRGHHLQRRLMLFAEEELRKEGYHHLICTIHPENKYSMNNALSLGYEVKKICEKYGGYHRAVLLKTI